MKLWPTIVLIIFTAYSSCKGSSDEAPVTPPVVTDSTFKNPLLASGPDPWVVQKDGYYYYTQTSGNKIVLWKTQHIEDLKNAVSATVWTPAAGTAYSDDIWAPELHYLNNKWYVYFSADSSGINATHRIYVLENESADPLNSGWVFKGKITAAEDNWAIDGSVFTYKNTSYIVWSGWQGVVDGEQDIYIAKLSDPWTISGNRVPISQPVFDWETQVTQGINVKVNEGPEALQNANGNLFLTFSAGGCWSDDYCLGLLTLKDGGDPMVATDWTKSPQPVFTKNTTGNAFGPGHNGFFKSPDGSEDWIIYHANNSAGQGCGDQRNPRIQKFTWNSDGTPAFGTPVSTSTAIEKPSGE